MNDFGKQFERAEKYLAKGRHDAALREYLEVLRQVPTHERAASAAADLYVTLGRGADATALLRGMFARQLAGGEQDVLSTYKKLIRTGGATPDHHLQIARLLERSDRSEALDAYSTALRGFISAKRNAEAIACIEAAIAIEPTAARLQQLSQLAIEAGDMPKASAALLKAGLLRAPEDIEAAIRLYEQANKLNASDINAALTYARALLMNESAENGERAASVLQAHAQNPQVNKETRVTYGRALMAAGRVRDAEPYAWEMLELAPDRVDPILQVMTRLLDSDEVSQALEWAQRLEQHQRRAGRLRNFTERMSGMATQYASCIAFQEYLVELFNSTNREHDYCQTLLRLFEMHYACGNFLKAGECLDRAAEVDPYEPGHKRRLEMLQGKVDSNRLSVTANRLAGAAGTEGESMVGAGEFAPENEPTVLQDLLLQAEIFLQYSMRTRAAERLQRILKVFPGEELKNDKLRELCAAVGLPLPAAAPQSAVISPAVKASNGGVNDLARVSDITRNIHRQGTIKSVLFTSVNEVGRLWSVSRCIAVLCSPGKPPSAALEYCAPGIKASDVHAIVRLVGLLQPLAIAHGPLTVPSESNSAQISALRASAAAIGIQSFMAIPLMEGNEHVGILLLAESNTTRTWAQADITMCRTIAEQVVLALANVRLRSLIRNLAVTDEQSGLIKRSSYLDVLLSEMQRAVRQRGNLSVVLLRFGLEERIAGNRPGSEAMMQQIGQFLSSHIRQNDLAVRYDNTVVALILTGTNEKGALLAAEQLSNALSSAGLPPFVAGVAEAVIHLGFDVADIVTEAINRVEAALQAAQAQGGHPVHVLPPTLYTSARA